MDTSGLPNADHQGIYEPQELARSQVLDKLAGRVAPPSVKQHIAEQEAGREQRERAWRDEQAARLQAERDMLAAGKPLDCVCCGAPIETAIDAVDAHGSLVHAGECAERWGSAIDEEAADAREPTSSAPTTKLHSRRDADASDDAFMLQVC